MAAIGIIGTVSSVALAEDIPTSGEKGGTGTINEWGQCLSGIGGMLPVFGKILPAPGQSKLDFGADTVTALVYNGSTTDKTVTLATYKEYYAHQNYDDVFSATGELILFGQRISDYEEMVDEKVIKPGQFATLTAQMPGCSTQIDLFCGKAVNYLGGDNRYLQRNLAWYHAHDTVTNAPKITWCDMKCTLQMVAITGVSEGQKVEPGTKLAIGATTSGRTPYAVRFTLEGPNGLVSTNDDLRPAYSYNGDTSALPEGDYTLTASVFDTIRHENNRPCDTKTVHFRIVRVHYYKVGFKPNDYCALSPDMEGDENTGLTTPQWVGIPAWVETYNKDRQLEGGLSLKVSSSWKITHPTTIDSESLEQTAAQDMVCPGNMLASTCNAGQVSDGDVKDITTDATGRHDFTIKVWWPGIMLPYADLPDYRDLTNGRIMEDSLVETLYRQYMSANYPGLFDQIPIKYVVEDLYNMTVVGGGANGNFPLVNLEEGQPVILVNKIGWSLPTNMVINHGKDMDYQRTDGCTLTLVPNSMQ